MKKLLFLAALTITLGLGTAHAGVDDYTPEQIEEMPHFSSIEQQRCPSAKFTSVKKRLECKKEVRVEIYEKRKAHEDNKDQNG